MANTHAGCYTQKQGTKRRLIHLCLIYPPTLVARGSDGAVETGNQITKHGTEPTIRGHNERFVIFCLWAWMSLSNLVLCPSTEQIASAELSRFGRQLMCLVHSKQRTSAGGHLASTSPTRQVVAGLPHSAQLWQTHLCRCCFSQQKWAWQAKLLCNVYVTEGRQSTAVLCI